MRFDRDLAPELVRAARAFSAVVVTGPRRAGKTYALRTTFPKAAYRLLEDPDVLARVRGDPHGFLDDAGTPLILDEIQNAPELFSYVRSRIDARPARKGAFLLTGSQDLSLMRGVTESMAGRAAIFSLLPLSAHEIGRWHLLRGGYPEVWLRPRSAPLWFRSYVASYIERDVRAVTAIHDLGLFRRFLALVASRNGHVVNKTELAMPLGVSVPTITQWLDILEVTGIIALVPPYFANFGKRIIKTPKLYFVDTGLLCHLLGIDSLRSLEAGTFVGPVFEAFVAQEILKAQLHHGRTRELYYFRDQQGLEVDFIVTRGEQLLLIEAKYGKTAVPSDARGVAALAAAMGSRSNRGLVVHRGGSSALLPNVRAANIDDFIAELNAK